MKKFLNLGDPFFAPIWIRVSIVVVTAIWGLIEFSAGEVFWGCLFVGISAFCARQFSTIDYNAGSED